MAQSSSRIPAAKATLKSLQADLERKGLRDVVEGLPGLEDVVIEPQDHITSEHPYKLWIGTVGNQDVAAMVSVRPTDGRSPDAAPKLKFHVLTHDKPVYKPGEIMDKIHFIEPFKEFWNRTSAQPVNSEQSWADRRRDMLKGLLYWYFLQEAASRNGALRLPETVRKKLFMAFEKLRHRESNKPRDDATPDVAGEFAAWQQRGIEFEAQQQMVESRMCGQHGVCEKEREITRKERDLEEEIRRGEEEGRERRRKIREMQLEVQLLRDQGQRSDSFTGLDRASICDTPLHRQTTRSLNATCIRNELTRRTKRIRPVIEDSESEIDAIDAPVHSPSHHPARPETPSITTKKPLTHDNILQSIEVDPDTNNPRTLTPAALLHSFQKSRKRRKTTEDEKDADRILRLKTGPLAWDNSIRAYIPLHDTYPDPNTITITHPSLPSPGPLLKQSPPLALVPSFLSTMKTAIAHEEDLATQLDSIECEQKSLLHLWQQLAREREKADEELRGNRAAIREIAEGLARQRSVGGVD